MAEQIKSLNDLEAIKLAYRGDEKRYKYIAYMCYGGSCISSGSDKVKAALLEEVAKQGLEKDVKVVFTGCMGFCARGPILIVEPEGVFYCELEAQDMRRVVTEHFGQGKVVEDFCFKQDDKIIPLYKDIPFFKLQKKDVLNTCGKIGFADLDGYIANDGYYGLADALAKKTPDGVIDEVRKAGLRGRGGGGFPAAMKWGMARKAPGDIKYVICNADEGDPGAFMDRSMLEGDPHRVIEGMLIAGYAIGAAKGYVYVRAEYPIAIERLKDAIAQARDRGLLGENIFGSDFSFDLEIRIGAGAFVCGEETALMASVEGRRGEPRQKPPYPVQAGLFGKPTIINNVETLANVPLILLKGAENYASVGSENNTGTKIFALAGKINNPGLLEVPMGTTLGEVLFDIGGGIPKGKHFKVAQTGGPSGGCLTAEFLNTPLDFDSLVALGAIIGSGGLVCMDEDSCMVDTARYFMEFVQEESCGKCVACRLGTKRMLEILERITQGKGEDGDIEKLIELGETIKDSALCGLGQTAPNPVLSTIKYFRDEYEEHIYKKKCRAGVCGDLFIAPCANACPANVNVPGYVALVAAGRMVDAYNLIRQDNPFPAVCGRVCTHPCEGMCRRAQLDDPMAIRDLKRYAADYVFNRDEPYYELVYPKNGKSVGIIGAGPSGLTCGYYLGKLGYDVTVYEQQPVAGGILRFGMPPYRMPKNILDKEINTIKNVGVNILTDIEVGVDITFNEIKEKHDSVYVAVGTQFSRQIGIPNEELDGIVHGLDFLRQVNLGQPIKVEGIVAVIGGGNTAIDAARTAVRMGADEVHVFYRRTQEDMPADKREVEEAIEEGVIIHPMCAPVRFVEGDNHNVSGMELIRMKLGVFGNDGRKKSVESPETNFLFNVDMVIPAVSQYSDFPFIRKDEVMINKMGSFVVEEETQMTSMPGVFAGGDVARGSDVCIKAIADGKRAAKAIDKYLGGSGELNTGAPIDIPFPTEDVDVEEHPRFEIENIAIDKRCESFDEVAIGFNRITAIAEAMRCLRCDRKA